MPYPTESMNAEMEEAAALIDEAPLLAQHILAAARAWWLDRVPTDNSERDLMVALGGAWPNDENGDEDDDDTSDL